MAALHCYFLYVERLIKVEKRLEASILIFYLETMKLKDKLLLYIWLFNMILSMAEKNSCKGFLSI